MTTNATETTAAALPPVRVEADVRQVAAFRLPVSVKYICAMVDGLTREYGKGLTMRQVGDSLIIEQPNAPAEARCKASPPAGCSEQLMDCEGCWTHSIPIEDLDGEACPLCGAMSMLCEQGDDFDPAVWGGGHNKAYSPNAAGEAAPKPQEKHHD